MRLRLKRAVTRAGLLVLLASSLVAPMAHAIEAPKALLDDIAPRLKLMGDATLRWMGFTIYDAALWSANDLFDGSSYSEPVVLSITYRKSISKDRLIRVTEKQWQKLNITNDDQRRAWLQKLHAIWPDVAPGDVIACMVMPSGTTRFFSRTEYLGEISDPQFGPGFLSIWLSPNSDLPKVRKQLLQIREI